MFRRQRKVIEVSLESGSVLDAVASVRARREQAGRDIGMSLRVYDDGRVHARMPGSRYNNPPYLRARFSGDGGSVTLSGVIHESVGQVIMPRTFMTMGVFLLAVAILLVVVGNPVPGSIICGIGGLVFLLLGWWLGKLRRTSFRIGSKRLMENVIPFLPARSAQPLS